ncbi:cytochrome c oxidase subunit NDUFA4 isoform X1 [Micropterus dolomieu]|uniref:cytochrome c oxidase subunit NDUFA4 isoform X1 n=1 Tax=Micropterus dolomieu TaxID=147949 RepID=UPI001E8D758B|nr:cytochrome c oxidase subunit NDUFA4 isoform X1 [Micropterus dolomieu]
MLMVHITADHLIVCLPSCVSGLELMHSSSPQLIPQFFFLSVGITGATLYLIRLARGPHVIFWDKKNNPEPWNKLDPTYQYKFLAVNTDYKNLKKDGPDF